MVGNTESQTIKLFTMQLDAVSVFTHTHTHMHTPTHSDVTGETTAPHHTTPPAGNACLQQRRG